MNINLKKDDHPSEFVFCRYCNEFTKTKYNREEDVVCEECGDDMFRDTTDEEFEEIEKKVGEL